MDLIWGVGGQKISIGLPLTVYTMYVYMLNFAHDGLESIGQVGDTGENRRLVSSWFYSIEAEALRSKAHAYVEQNNEIKF